MNREPASDVLVGDVVKCLEEQRLFELHVGEETPAMLPLLVQRQILADAVLEDQIYLEQV